MRLSATYWNINYKQLISLVPFINAGRFWSVFAPSAATIAPTQAQIDAAIAGAGSTAGAPCAPLPTCVYAIQDVRKQNLGNYKLDGIDFSANYFTGTSFGSVDAMIGGNYELNRKESPAQGAPFTDALAGNSRLRLRSSLGANVGNLRAQAVWSHSQGYDLTLPVGLAPQQTRVGSFDVFDLYFKYDVPGEGMFKDLAFTLNVNNVFNKDPPAYRLQQIVLQANGYANGNTVGRLVQVGVSKKF